MTMPDDAPPRKAKPSRWGLYAPFILLALAIVGWSGYWLFVRHQLEDRLTRGAADLQAAGYEAAWGDLAITGYPFRMEVEVTQARLREPSGWGLSAPRLKAVANAYELNHWVFNAPEGLGLSRPGSGEVAIGGQYLRASLVALDTAPRLSFEGEKMTFAPAPGAAPFAFSAADKLELHLAAAEPDKVQLQWRLTGATVRREGVFAQVAPLAPLSLTLAADIARRSGFAGKTWADSARRWADQGGSAQVSQFVVSAGDLSLSATGGPLTVGSDGRLKGALDLSLKQGALQPLTALGAALGAGAPPDPDAASSAAAVARARGEGGPGLQLVFQAGMTTLGPVRIGPAPRIY